MRTTLIFATAALILSAGVGGTAAFAQTAAPPADAAAPPPPSPPGPGGPGGPAWHHRFGPWGHGPGGGRLGWHARAMPFAPGTFGLFARQPDKHLSPADVQEIAQAILLWNGNHDWKVTQVEPGQNHRVTFAYAAEDGTVIAKFAIDQETGRITRVG